MTPAFPLFSMVARGQKPEPRQLIPKVLAVVGSKLMLVRMSKARLAPSLLVKSISEWNEGEML